MNKIDFKSCPFCKKPPYIKTISNGSSHAGFSISVTMGCNKCGFYMVAKNEFRVDPFMNIVVVEDEISKMFERWNNRDVANDVTGIHNKAVDEYFNRLCKESESIRPVGWTGRYSVVTIEKAQKIAEQMKG